MKKPKSYLHSSENQKDQINDYQGKVANPLDAMTTEDGSEVIQIKIKYLQLKYLNSYFVRFEKGCIKQVTLNALNMVYEKDSFFQVQFTYATNALPYPFIIHTHQDKNISKSCEI